MFKKIEKDFKEELLFFDDEKPKNKVPNSFNDTDIDWNPPEEIDLGDIDDAYDIPLTSGEEWEPIDCESDDFGEVDIKNITICNDCDKAFHNLKMKYCPYCGNKLKKREVKK